MTFSLDQPPRIAEGSPAPRPTLGSLTWLFLRLGLVAFGGPAAHLALLEDEFVHTRGWVTREEFLDLLGLASLLPGPTSTEVAMLLGRTCGGLPGLLLAGLGFITPAALLVLALAALYLHYGSLPVTHACLGGIQPVVVALVAQAVYRLGRPQYTRLGWMACAAGAALARCLGFDALAILGSFALLATLLATLQALQKQRKQCPSQESHFQAPLPPTMPWGTLKLMPGLGLIGPLAILWVFVRLGCVVFGSGYVLLAFLQADLVERLHWVTTPQLLDALAVGQVTPGPVFTTATFLGYLVGGLPGAAAATVGIFLPAFVLSACCGPLLDLMRSHPRWAAALDGLQAASLGLMAAVTAHLAWASCSHPLSAGLCLLSLGLLLRTSIKASWLLGGGALVGCLEHALRFV